ncbi:MAG: RDD family protein [Methylacidiphilales bacterium]|nr:RDD family protein [Candidatus Methylacidiphilales bacterium]MDW8348905.1 RDD family protein [Verrucomicrobiae bacterium]
MSSDTTLFWIRGEDGNEYGPVGISELKVWLAEDRIGPDSEATIDIQGRPKLPWRRLDTLYEARELWKSELKKIQTWAQQMPTLAPLSRRIWAGIIDTVFVLLLMIFIFSLALIYILNIRPEQIENLSTTLLQSPSEPSAALVILMMNLLSYTVMLIYFGYFHLFREGRTLGMTVCGLKVADEKGQALRKGQALLRTFGIVLTIHFYGIGFLPAFFTERRQAFHDLISRTLVILKNRVEN